MRAVYITEFDSLDRLEFREVHSPPPPEKGEVLVRVRAAGVNRADLLQARGLYPPPHGYSAHIPGLEFAGEIEATGKGVRGWSAGDRVMGISAGECQAEYLKVDSRLLMRLPDGMDFIHAAAIPEAYITAHDAVVTQAKLKKGESLLIHAVGSSVGLAALQIASALGAQVLGTSRTADKLERCSGMGLHRGVVVSSPPQFASSVLHETQGLGVSVILDLVGAKYFAENMASLGSKGRLLLVGLQSGSRTEFDMGVALEKRATIIGTVLRGRSVEEKAAATKLFSKAILPFLEAGEIRPTIDRIFPAEKVREAYIYLQSNSSFGKVVLEF